jgi:hypothetical protein
MTNHEEPGLGRRLQAKPASLAVHSTGEGDVR